MKIITKQEWIDTYKPLMDEDGGLLWTECRDPDFLARKDLDPRYWWTSKDSEGDDSIFIENGFGVVNRIQYIQCEVPWEGKAKTIQVQDDDLRFSDEG